MQKTHITDKSRTAYILLLILAIFVNLCAINTPFFTDDPGLFGSIAKQLVYKHDFFQLFSYGKDWLDKPHLPFWLILMSFKAFGIHTWTYKLPALICFLLSLLYTYLFTKKYYGWQIAMMAVLIISTSLHIIMSNTDVRAEPYLMAFIIGAIYHISYLEKRFTAGHFIMAALLTAFAVMTKGIFVMVCIYGALGGQLLLQGRLRELFHIKWIALLLLTIIFTAPELYALYIQFDIHPEKVVFHKQHVSGIKWFLWDSQFGRFANNGPITRKSGDIFFFAHTLLWAFAPWCLLFYYATFKTIKNIIAGIKFPEYYALSGGLLLLFLFSISGFQLPFYTNIIFPLFAIITARFCHERLSGNAQRAFRLVAQWIYMILLLIIVFALHYFLRPSSSYYLIIDAIALIVLSVIIYKARKAQHIKVFFLNCVVMLFAGYYVNTTFYPIIVAHQAQLEGAGEVNELFPPDSPVYVLKDKDNIFQFYCQKPVNLIEIDQFATAPTPKNALFYVDQESIDYLNKKQIPFIIINSFWDYPQENILPAFINHATRNSTLQKDYLIRKP